MIFQLIAWFTLAIIPFSSFASWQKQADDQFKVELSIAVPAYTIEVEPPSGSSAKKAVFEPHSRSKTGVGLSYRNLGISASTTNSTNSEDDRKFGTSKSTDFYFRFFGKRTYEFFYQSYQGYYLKNSDELDPSYVGNDVKIQRPDMKSRHFGLNFYWNFHEDDFSQALAFEQAGIPKESAWGSSWLVHLSDSSMTADSAWIPTAANAHFGKAAGMKELKRQTLATGFAVGGILTASHLYFTAMVGVGVASQNAIASFENAPSEKAGTLGSYVTLRTGLGYNGIKNVFGIQFLGDSVATEIAQSKISGVSAEISVFYAYRFDGVKMPLADKVSSWLD